MKTFGIVQLWIFIFVTHSFANKSIVCKNNCVAHPIPVADSVHLGNVAIADTTTLLTLDTVRGYEHTLLFNLQNPSADTLYIRKAGTSGNAWSDQMNGFTMPPQSSTALTFTATLHPGAFYKVITFYFTRGRSNKKEEKLNLIYKDVNIAVD